MPDDQLTSLLDAQILDRIRAIGLPNLPSGTGVVPQATSFKVLQVTPRPASVEVVLTWIEPISIANPVDHYIISVTGAVGNNRQPAAPYVVSKSPAKLSINLTPGLTGLTFQIQTVLKNGFVSDILTAPTTGAQVTPGNQENGVPSEVTGSTLTITSAPTTLDTYVIPANVAKQGSIFRYTASGDYFISTGVLNPAVTILTYINGSATTGASIGYNGTPASSARSPWRFWYEICFRSIGTSASVAITSNISAPDSIQAGSGSGLFTVDSTVPITVRSDVSAFAGFSDIKRYISYQEIFKDARF